MDKYADDKFSFELIDGILHVLAITEFVDFKTIDDAINKRNEYLKDKKYPMFSDIRKVKSITREARERLAAEDAGTGVNAVAILVSTKAQRIIYSFFNSIYGAPAPAKIFSNKEKALAWLQQYK
ncbi:MAG: STAS/SEC14 domain-containing protein [Bacteroidales bacterium]|nr:STAS/SEC14 domain-containing protein [Bacteroidales bacterium]